MNDKLVMSETILQKFLAKLDDKHTHPDEQTMMQLLWQAAQEVVVCNTNPVQHQQPLSC